MVLASSVRLSVGTRCRVHEGHWDVWRVLVAGGGRV